jgi:transposase
LDAIRIAGYIKKNYSSLNPWQPPRTCIEQLKKLATIRRRLLKIKVMLTNQDKINAYFHKKEEVNSIGAYSLESLKAVKNDIEAVQKEMDKIVESDEKLSSLMYYVTSVPHIGKVIATQIIIWTNEFLDINNAKKFASYCGVAPFEWESGKSVKGRTKVSHYANKELKSLLHIAAIGFVRQPDRFLGKYYQRKVKEGKNKMSVLNAIRNKLLQRVFSCVNNSKLYQEI